MRKFLVLICIILNACAVTDKSEYASFKIGADKFDSLEGTFERELCSEKMNKIEISLSLMQSEKIEIFRLAKLDVAEGNLELDDLEKLCVSSYPYEITYGDNIGKTTTSCFFPLRDDESRVANFVFALKNVQELPKTSCRFY